MTPTEAAERWANHWKHSWEASDVERIVGLYAGDVVFSTGPFREPYRGTSGVREYVARVFGEEQHQRVWVSRPIVDGTRASISWWAAVREEGTDITLAGTSVLTFDDEGLVVSQWDTWNQAEGRLEPPAPSPFA